MLWRCYLLPLRSGETSAGLPKFAAQLPEGRSTRMCFVQAVAKRLKGALFVSALELKLLQLAQQIVQAAVQRNLVIAWRSR